MIVVVVAVHEKELVLAHPVNYRERCHFTCVLVELAHHLQLIATASCIDKIVAVVESSCVACILRLLTQAIVLLKLTHASDFHDLGGVQSIGLTCVVVRWSKLGCRIGLGKLTLGGHIRWVATIDARWLF